jgi:hypothetical protein
MINSSHHLSVPDLSKLPKIYLCWNCISVLPNLRNEFYHGHILSPRVCLITTRRLNNSASDASLKIAQTAFFTFFETISPPGEYFEFRKSLIQPSYMHFENQGPIILEDLTYVFPYDELDIHTRGQNALRIFHYFIPA